MKTGLKLALILFALAATHAHGHHAWASIFDAEGDVEIEGVVTDILWRNPHVQFKITVDSGTPNQTVWTLESNAVARLTRMGVNKDVINIGDVVKAAGLPSLAGQPEMFVNHLLLADNTEVIMSRTAGRRWTDDAGNVIGNTDALHGGVVEDNFDQRPTSIFGVWHVIYDAEGSHRAGRNGAADWTEHGQAFLDAQQAAGLGGRPDRHDCSPRSAFAALGEPYPIALVDLGDTIEIRLEFLDTYRTVHMTPNQPFPEELPRDHLGYSRGHWFGDTLVVETLFYREGGINGDDFMQVHETFHLSDDHNRLAYSQVIVDPLMRKTPSMTQKWWQHIPGTELQPYSCAGAI